MNIEKIKEAIEHLNLANCAQQAADITHSEDLETDIVYEIHNAIEDIINLLEDVMDGEVA
jgi:hypothetical protein